MNEISIFDIYKIAEEKLKSSGLSPYPGSSVDIYSGVGEKVYKVHIPINKNNTCVTTISVSYDEAHGIKRSTENTTKCSYIW